MALLIMSVLPCCACCATKSRQVTCKRNCLLFVNLPKAVPKPTSCFRGIPAASFACAPDGATVRRLRHTPCAIPAPHACSTRLRHAVARARNQGVYGRGADLLFADVVDSVSM
eukprot:scaffold89432_cov67-Phaeocystis_antarctica.AAC.4